MVVKVYVSGLSGNKEVKKRQQRVLMILDSKTIKYEVVDITEPTNEDQRDFMRDKCTNNTASGDNKDSNEKTKTKFVPIPPQIFNDEIYCGDYDGFDIANEIDKLEEFLKLEEVENHETNGDRNKQDELVSKQNDINNAVSDVIGKISSNTIDEDFANKQNNDEDTADKQNNVEENKNNEDEIVNDENVEVSEKEQKDVENSQEEEKEVEEDEDEEEEEEEE